MKKFKALVIGLILGLGVDAVMADPAPLAVSRVEADVYRARSGETFETSDCTQTAHAMGAKVDTSRGTTYLVFLDREGQEEGECPVRSVTTPPVAVTTRKTAHRRVRVAAK